MLHPVKEQLPLLILVAGVTAPKLCKSKPKFYTEVLRKHKIKTEFPGFANLIHILRKHCFSEQFGPPLTDHILRVRL